MNIEEFRLFCLSLPHTSEGLPFDANTLVFRVADKIFAITDLESFESVNLKCDPETAVLLRETYDFVLPGYHMNKKHWNTVRLVPALPEKLLKEWIQHSYELVWNSLPRKTREALGKEG